MFCEVNTNHHKTEDFKKKISLFNQTISTGKSFDFRIDTYVHMHLSKLKNDVLTIFVICSVKYQVNNQKEKKGILTCY